MSPADEPQFICRPFYDEDGIAVWHGDALDVMATLADESVDIVVTSCAPR